MRKSNLIFITIAGLAALLFTLPARAGQVTPREVVDRVEKAVQLVLDKGEAEAFALLGDPNGDWVDHDLYVFIYDFDGNVLVHVNKNIQGKNIMKIKDIKGNVFAAEFVRIGKSDQGEGWCEYWWPKPGEKEAVPKVSYIKRIPGKNMIAGMGVYDFTLDEAKKATGK